MIHHKDSETLSRELLEATSQLQLYEGCERWCLQERVTIWWHDGNIHLRHPHRDSFFESKTFRSVVQKARKWLEEEKAKT